MYKKPHNEEKRHAVKKRKAHLWALSGRAGDPCIPAYRVFLLPSKGNEWRKDYKLQRLSNFYLIAQNVALGVSVIFFRPLS